MMTPAEWFSGGASRAIRHLMLFWIGHELLSMAVRFMASRPYETAVSGIALWSVVYGVAYLFRRR
jgi:hypothetical protein